jgi:hypothetical protein
MEENLKRIVGQIGIILLGSILILVGLCSIVIIAAHVIMGGHMPKNPSPLEWTVLLLSVLIGVLMIYGGLRLLRTPKDF